MKIKRKTVLAAALSLALALSLSAGIYADTPEEDSFDVSFSRIADVIVCVDGEVSGELSQNDVVCGELIRLTAPAVGGKTFSHWAFGTVDAQGNKTISDVVASTRQKYNFTLNGKTAIFAVYDAAADASKPCVAFSSTVKDGRTEDEYIRMTASYSLPSSVADPAPNAVNPVLGEVGIRYTTNALLGCDAAAGDLIANPVSGIDVRAALTSETLEKGVRASTDSFYYAMGDWTLGVKNPGDGAYVYAVAYITYEGQTVFSDVKALTYSGLDYDSTLTANMAAPFYFE